MISCHIIKHAPVDVLILHSVDKIALCILYIHMLFMHPSWLTADCVYCYHLLSACILLQVVKNVFYIVWQFPFLTTSAAPVAITGYQVITTRLPAY